MLESLLKSVKLDPLLAATKYGNARWKTIAVTHRMALDALKAFQFALEDADGDIPEDVHSPLFDRIMVVLHAMEAMSKGVMGRVWQRSSNWEPPRGA